MSMGNITYTCKQSLGELITVVKWSDGDLPENEYDVLPKRGGNYTCSCWGYQKRPGQEHKHIRIAKQWESDGKPLMAVYRLTSDNTPVRIA